MRSRQHHHASKRKQGTASRVSPGCVAPSCSFSADGSLFLAGTMQGLKVLNIEPPTRNHLGMSSPYCIHLCDISAPAHTTTSSSSPFITENNGSGGLWHAARVHTVAMAGDMPLIAVVFHDAYVRAGNGGTSSEGVNVNAAAAAAPLRSSSETDEGGKRYVYLFDAITGEYMAELYFSGAVVETLLANSRMLVVGMSDCFHVVDLQTLQHIRQQSMYTPLNPSGILALSQTPLPNIQGASSRTTYRIAFPHTNMGGTSSSGRGDVLVLSIHFPVEAVASSPLRTQSPFSAGGGVAAAIADDAEQKAKEREKDATIKTAIISQSSISIAAHNHGIAALALNQNGSVLATASALGTTVKLFDSFTGALLVEFQRGKRAVSIYALALDSTGATAAALSDRGTLHIFHDDHAVPQPHVAAASAETGQHSQKKEKKLHHQQQQDPRRHIQNVMDKPRAVRKKTVQPLHQLIQQQYRTQGFTEHSEAALAAAAAIGGLAEQLPAHGWCYRLSFLLDGKAVCVAQARTTGASTAGNTGSAAGVLQVFEVASTSPKPVEQLIIMNEAASS